MNFYRLLLKLYPARFREEYTRQMEIEFADDYRDAEDTWARLRFWIRALADLLVSIPAELVREALHDLRHAVRLYSRRKFITAAAVLALAMAIGTATGVFSVLNALLWRELPFREPDRLVEVWGGNLGGFGTKEQFDQRRADAREYLDDGALYTTNVLNVDYAGVPRRQRVTEATANFFRVMGVAPVTGRDFLPSEDNPSENQVAIVSHRVWQQDFGADPQFVGSKLAINGIPMIVVGIAPALFDFPSRTDVWTATGLDVMRISKGSFFSQVIGRLKPGLTFDQAQKRFIDQQRRESPKVIELDPGVSNENLPHLTPLQDKLAQPIRGATLVLFGTVAFVLLIASVNIAHLLLARVNERRRELAVRSALGASRARIVQQFVVEAMALTLTASLLGLLVAQATTRLMTSFAPAELDVQTYSILDWRVLAFAVGTAVISGLAFGIVPAYALSRRGVHGQETSRLRTALIVLQSALTLILLGGAFTLGRGFLNMLQTDLGYRTANVVVLNASLEGTSAAKQSAQFHREVVEKLRAVPGVEAVGVSSHLPLQQYSIYSAGKMTAEGGRDTGLLMFLGSGEEYFSSLRQPIVAGRDFSPEERAGKVPAIIVNERVARATGLGTAIVGKDLRNAIVGKDLKGKSPSIVIGVVRDARHFGPGSESPSLAYFPLEKYLSTSVTFTARVRGSPSAMVPILRDAAASVNRSVPFHDIRLMDDLLAQNLARPRFYTMAIAAFGGFALLLAVIGIYGVASNSVSQRTKEIGVRIAVGAAPREVRQLFLRQNLLPASCGIAIGIAGSLALGRFVKSLLASAEPVDLWTAAAISALLLAICGLAVWQATVRIARLNPAYTLRVD